MRKLTRSGVEALRREMPVLSSAIQREIVGGVGGYSAGNNYLAYDPDSGYYLNPYYQEAYTNSNGDYTSGGWMGGYFVQPPGFSGEKIRYVQGYYSPETEDTYIDPVYDENGEMISSGYFQYGNSGFWVDGYFELVDNPESGSLNTSGGSGIFDSAISCEYNSGEGYYIAEHYVEGYTDEATGEYVSGYYVSGHFQNVNGYSGESLYYIPAHYSEGYNLPGTYDENGNMLSSGEWVNGNLVEGHFVSMSGLISGSGGMYYDTENSAYYMGQQPPSDTFQIIYNDPSAIGVLDRKIWGCVFNTMADADSYLSDTLNLSALDYYIAYQEKYHQYAHLTGGIQGSEKVESVLNDNFDIQEIQVDSISSKLGSGYILGSIPVEDPNPYDSIKYEHMVRITGIGSSGGYLYYDPSTGESGLTDVIVESGIFMLTGKK